MYRVEYRHLHSIVFPVRKHVHSNIRLIILQDQNVSKHSIYISFSRSIAMTASELGTERFLLFDLLLIHNDNSFTLNLTAMDKLNQIGDLV